MAAQRPGWFDDPHDATMLRYWDGNRWTEYTAPGTAPPPGTPRVRDDLPPPSVATAEPATDSTHPLDRFGRWFRAKPVLARIAIVGVPVLVALTAYASLPESYRFDQDSSGDRRESPAPSPTCEIVRYRVGGTAFTVSITMENASGNTEQFDSVAVPFVESLGCLPVDQFVYISAQNNGESGSVECGILRGGQSVADARSSGAFVIASCSD